MRRVGIATDCRRHSMDSPAGRRLDRRLCGRWLWRRPLRQNPVMWDSDGATKLESESAPFLAQGGSATALCPEYTGELLDMLMNSGLAYATCRGNNPMAFRAYAVPCDGCGRVPSAAQNDGSWLAQPDPSRLLLTSLRSTPAIGDPGGRSAPGFRAARGWENHWVTVTGHFDDPASSSCPNRPRSTSTSIRAGRRSSAIAGRASWSRTWKWKASPRHATSPTIARRARMRVWRPSRPHRF